MRDQSVFAESTQKWGYQNLEIDNADRQVLRELAVRVAEIASSESEREKAALWRAHNDLQPTRPLIFCDPENGWNEIIPERELRCTSELARNWENRLRKEIFWGSRMGDDRVTTDYFNVYYSYEDTGWGMNEKIQRTEEKGSYAWEAPLTDYAMMDRLQYPRILVDYSLTDQLFSLATDVFGDILRVRKRGQWWWSIGLTYVLVNLRGLEQFMMDMYDYPDELHHLMAFLRDGFLEKLNFLESNGLLSLNNDESYVGSGGFGFTSQLPAAGYDERVRTQDMWGFLESQETVSVSPAMFKEFVFDYQLPLLKRFGLNCYGCCEPLDKRWDIIKDIPGLRRVSVSPWADPEKMAGQLADRYVYSLKPNPAYLAVDHIDEYSVRADMRKAFLIARDCRVEAIMKDNHTINNNVNNVVEWCRIAKEEARRYE